MGFGIFIGFGYLEFRVWGFRVVNPRKLEHGFRTVRARIPYTFRLLRESGDLVTMAIHKVTILVITYGPN